MDNTYPPPGDGRQDRTLPHSLEQDGLPVSHSHDGGSRRHAGGTGPRQPGALATRRPGRLTRWAAVLGIAAVLAAGGSFLGVRLAGAGGSAVTGSLPGAVPGAASSGHTASSGQAAGSGQAASALSAMFGSPTSATAMTASGSPATAGVTGKHARALRRCLASARRLLAAGHRAAARARLRQCGRHFLRLRLFRHAEHGQITFMTRHGKTRTIAFERGVIQSVTGGTFVVKAADGTTWTWHLTGKTIIVKGRHRVGSTALAVGEHVFVAGPVISGADDARLILIHR